jgi:hypothetical protein
MILALEKALTFQMCPHFHQKRAAHPRAALFHVEMSMTTKHVAHKQAARFIKDPIYLKNICMEPHLFPGK